MQFYGGQFEEKYWEVIRDMMTGDIEGYSGDQ